ncbi:MAG: SMI1/KNR4 family protein [Clostridia bacterium]|nr:SMI1/KNR4 family protein [Clostridia bacterium]
MNTMKKEFDEMVKLCEEKVEEYGERASYFMEPATEEEILDWENKTGIKMPEDYREWLKLTANCQMCSTIASLVFPELVQPDYLPEDYVLIGYVIGDGEVLCFSKNTRRYVRYFEGRDNKEYNTFIDFLNNVKSLIKGEVPKIKFTDDDIKEMLAELEALEKGEIGN